MSEKHPSSLDYLNDKTVERRHWLVEPVCDGLHDEGAPEQYLCSRCFPDGAPCTPDDESPEETTQDVLHAQD